MLSFANAQDNIAEYYIFIFFSNLVIISYIWAIIYIKHKGRFIMNEFEKIRKMYDNGFRCIRYDDTKDGDMCIYFKNFDNEDSLAMRVNNFEEKMQIKNFIKENSMR